MTRAHFVKKARKDNKVAKEGESYWWWKFRHGGKRLSKTKPKPSQLTQSEFLGRYYEIQESMEGIQTLADLQSAKDDWLGQLKELRDETDDKYNNMPSQLQDGDTGQLLQERMQGLEDWINSIENIDVPDTHEEEGDEKETEEEFVDRLLQEIRDGDPGLS